MPPWAKVIVSGHPGSLGGQPQLNLRWYLVVAIIRSLDTKIHGFTTSKTPPPSSNRSEWKNVIEHLLVITPDDKWSWFSYYRLYHLSIFCTTHLYTVLFVALFSSCFICADKDAHENSSFYYINPHEFQSCASLSEQIKKGGKWRISFSTRNFWKSENNKNWYHLSRSAITSKIWKFYPLPFCVRSVCPPRSNHRVARA